LDFDVGSAGGFIPATCQNVDDFNGLLYIPVLAGLWKQHETCDGTYTLDDLLDIVEALSVKAENERRLAEAVRMEANLKRG
jgi:hypothetical protein